MKNRFFRSLSVMLMLAMAIALVLPLTHTTRVNAQGDSGCTLSPEECDLITGAVAGLSSVDSVNVNSLHLFLNFDAGPDTGAGSVELNGSGPIVVTNQGIAPFETDMTLDAEIVSEGEPTEISGARIIVKDDMAYAYDPETDEWSGSALSASDLQGMEELDPAALAEGLNTFGDLATDAVVWTHGDDIEVDGQTLDVFTVDVSLGTLLTSDAVIEQLAILAADTLGEGTDPQSMTFALGFLLGDLGDQLDAGTFAITMDISEEDGNLYGFAFNIDQTVDLAFLSGLLGDGGEEIPPITIQMDLELSLGGYGGAYDIVPPEEYTEIDSLDLGGLDGLGGLGE